MVISCFENSFIFYLSTNKGLNEYIEIQRGFSNDRVCLFIYRTIAINFDSQI